jgi:hypothetical protein
MEVQVGLGFGGAPSWKRKGRERGGSLCNIGGCDATLSFDRGGGQPVFCLAYLNP